jgi:hypothetical protein
MNIFKDKKILIYSGIFLGAEVLSFLAYYFTGLGNVLFLILALSFLGLSLYKLECGLYLILAELIVGSQGYLFYFSSGGLILSLRIAMWLIIMAVWFAGFLREWLKTKKNPFLFFKDFAYLKNYAYLLFFVLFGLVLGIINGHSFNNIFLDFNAWLFFALVLPFYTIFKKVKREELLKNIRTIFIAGLISLCFKTLVSLYIFTHGFAFGEVLYSWLRTTLVGEVTSAGAGFYRIFFQSHIYVVVGFILGVAYLWQKLIMEKIKIKRLIPVLIGLSILFSVILISLSRSFWLGLVAGLLFLGLVFAKQFKFKEIALAYIYLIQVFFSGLIILAIVALFPIPKSGVFDFSLLANRADFTKSESAISSRYALFGELQKEIISSPILGKGFGATVTYKSSDPRILEKTADGLFTTYAFEWGYLDIWLKISLFGLLAYLWLLFFLIKRGIKGGTWLPFSLISGLIVLIVVNIFTPYLNHPLGIIYLILVSLIV